MAKVKKKFSCSNCGYESLKWLGKCPECGEWNTLEEELYQTKKSNTSIKYIEAKKLKEVKSSNTDRIVTGITEFNRVMGGGITKDSITIITAKPGAGKSTLLLQVANDIAIKGYKVLYASGEESESQIKNRADRLFGNVDESIWVMSDMSMDNVINSIHKVDADVIIIDSIQTFTLDAFPNSRAGSPTQTMECANELLKIAKDNDRSRCVIMVGQMTKNDEIAGLRALEHLVDTVLVIEGESTEELRALLVTKNRFGGTQEMGYFTMGEKGLVSLDNPSEFFMTQREDNQIISGSSLTVVKEGTRPIIVEIESLVSNSFTPFPTRISECVGKNQLNTLISILEERGGIKLFDKNVVIKTTGGIKLKEQSVNLAIIMSIVSSFKNKGIPDDTVFISEVGLTGELKRVPSLETRIKELERIGFNKVYVAKNSINNTDIFNIEIKQLGTLYEVIYDVFREK